MKNKVKIKYIFVLGVLVLVLITGITLSVLNTQKKSENYWKYSVGKMVSFGKYEQDGDLLNGKEKIEWIVLDKEDNKFLLLSKYCLYVRPCKNGSNGWKDSHLREWVNSTFYKSAFNSNEKNNITDTKSSCYGKLVEDKVFVLSNSEVDKYLHIYEVKQTIPTQYVLNNFKKNLKFIGKNCETWVREDADEYPKTKIRYGEIQDCINNTDAAAIRPAIWVDIKGLN